MRLIVLTLLAIIPSCADETVSGYADAGATYRLAEIDGSPYAARATISFPEEGVARGDAPCNNWSATQSAPYPWIDLDAYAVTRRACPELREEGMFLAALAEMSLAEVQGPVLILSNDEGREMVFREDR